MKTGTGDKTMIKNRLNSKQKQLDVDIWIISIITLSIFVLYAVNRKQFMSFAKDDNISVLPRLLLSACFQFGIAGFGITSVCILRKEKFTEYGLIRKNLGRAIIGTAITFIPYICYTFVSGNFRGYHPFRIMLIDDVMASDIPYSISGMALIIVVWGFFEGFNYAVICEKINRRYPAKNQWLDYGAIICAVICILFHPFNISFWGILEIITTFIAIYGMLIIRKKTGNSWGCVFAFCFIWNAL